MANLILTPPLILQETFPYFNVFMTLVLCCSLQMAKLSETGLDLQY